MNRIPGKVFILGEYAVMNGGSALLSTLQPGYLIRQNDVESYHPDSPAGRFLSDSMSFRIEGKLGPGFGTSTAELLAVNAGLKNPWSLDQLWIWYRKNFEPASGADLAVQHRGFYEQAGSQKNQVYLFKSVQHTFELKPVTFPDSFLLNTRIYRSPETEKLPTHSDLSKKNRPMVDLALNETLISQFLETFDPVMLTRWSEALSELGLESAFSSKVRKAFQNLDGVLGVKGCGAGLNDCFLVSLDPQKSPSVSTRLESIQNQFGLTHLGSLKELELK